MRQRILGLAVAAVITVASLVSVAGQAPTSATQSGPALKTSWGEPDLQGIWREDNQIPLQRPAKFAGKEFLTDAERIGLDRERETVPRFGDVGLAPKGTIQDLAGAYNAVFTSRRYSGRRTSLIVDPPDGRIPPLTPDATQRREAMRAYHFALLQSTDVCKNKAPGCAGGTYGPPSPRRTETPPYYVAVNVGPGGGGGAINRSDNPEDRGLSERCLGAILPDFGGAVGGFFQFVQSPGAVTIFYDTGQGQGWHRVIPVDGSPHLPQSVRLWWGDSRGRWEGNTLVVDVTNFTPKTDFRGSRENLHLVERWTRTGPDVLEYVVTIDDPTTWTKTWTVKQELNKQSDQANRLYKEPRCHEGNFGMIGAMSNARAEEQAFAEGRGPDPATVCNAACGSGIEDQEGDVFE
jgi:hypothetical protein